MNLIRVKATAGVAVPMEDKPRTHITDAADVQVVDSTYYQRRITDGDLILIEEDKDTALAEAAPPVEPGKKVARNANHTPGEKA